MPSEEIAFQRLCRAELGWVHALARQLTGDGAAAEDLAQETWLQALRGPAPRGSALRSWLAAVMRNVARSQARAGRRRDRHERALAVPASAEDPAGAAARLELHRRLVDAVAALREPYRSAVLWRYFEGLTPTEIAARTGAPVRTVHTRLQRALATLRRQLHASAESDRRRAVGLGSAAICLGGIMSTKIKLAAAGAAVVAAALVVVPWAPWRETEPVEPGPAVPVATLRATAPAAEEAAPERQAIATAPESQEPASASVRSFATEDATTVRRSGVVLDVFGQPVAGVTVSFSADGDGVRPEAVTDGAGAFSLELRRGTHGSVDVATGDWIVVYRPVVFGGPGLLGAGQTVELTLVVARAVDVGGLVVDPAGRPVVGARVRLGAAPPSRAAFARSLQRSVVAEHETETDGDGRFALRVPDLDEKSLATSHPAFDVDTRPVPAARTDLWIQLAAGSEPLEGRVVDVQGAPVAGAVVLCGDAIVASRDDGTFALDLRAIGGDAPCERHRWLVAGRQGRVPARLRCPGEDPRRAADWPQPLVLRLGGVAGAISGTVLDADGAPVPGAQVRVAEPEPIGDCGASATPPTGWTYEHLARASFAVGEDGAVEASEWATDHGPGRFVVGGLLDRAYRLRVEVGDALRGMVSAPIQAGATDVELRLPVESMWPALVGAIVDRRGAPVPHAGVWFVREIGGERRETSRRGTDDAGAFRVEGLARGVDTLLVQAQNIAQPSRFSLQALGAPAPLRLVIPVAATVRVEATAVSQSADAVAFRDAAGRAVAVTLTQGNVAIGVWRAPLTDGATEVFTVPDLATEAVLLQGQREIARTRVDLAPGRAHPLRW
ncbi:MAG: sigma-70 family RNA polymerase sigma factor [Planctomycetota bacterium]